MRNKRAFLPLLLAVLLLVCLMLLTFVPIFSVGVLQLFGLA